MSGAGTDVNDATARFGSGRAVHRVEDAALLAGRGRFVDNVAEPGQTIVAFQRSPYAHARIVAVDAEAARAMPGVLAVYTGAELAAAGIKPMPTTPDFRRADGQQDGVAAAPRARARSARATSARRSSPWSPNRARPRATRSTAWSSSTRSCPPSPTSPPRPRPARRRSRADGARQHRRRDAPRRRREGGGGVRARRRPHRARPRQPARLAGGDGAAQRRRLVRRGERAADGADQQPDADRGRGRPRRRAAGHHAGAGPRPRRRRRRRLRHEDRHVPGRHRRRPRGARARPAGALAGRSQRGVPVGARPAATSRATPSSRSTPTARRWRCACARSPTSAPTRRRRASRSSC